MPPGQINYWRLGFWLLFYLGLVPYALPRCLDWLSRSSTEHATWGGLGLLGLAGGVVLSLYQAGRYLLR